jgi:hypothetical protein
MSMFMLHVYIHSACPCPCCTSMSLMYCISMPIHFNKTEKKNQTNLLSECRIMCRLLTNLFGLLSTVFCNYRDCFTKFSTSDFFINAPTMLHVHVQVHAACPCLGPCCMSKSILLFSSIDMDIKYGHITRTWNTDMEHGHHGHGHATW